MESNLVIRTLKPLWSKMRGEQLRLKWKKLSAKRLVVIALFALVVLGGSGVYALLNPTLRLTASITKTGFQMGETVDITIVLGNTGLWPITFSYDPLLFNFAVYDETGKEIFRWEYVAVILLRAGSNPITLWPTQTRFKTVHWEQEGIGEGDLYQVPEGTYKIVALARIVYMNKVFLLEAQPIMVTIE